METHGLVTEEELSIYSVIRGKLVDLDMLIPSLQLLEDPLVKLPSQVKPGNFCGRKFPQLEFLTHSLSLTFFSLSLSITDR